MTEDHHYSVSVAGVIVDDDGRALIVQRRDNGHWEPPGGVLEYGETIEDGLRREVYEETGLKVEPEALTGAYQNMSHHIVALVFRCHVLDGELTETSEAVDFRWTPATELPTVMTEAYAVRVLDALAHQDHPTIRAHDGTHLI